ncbi:hypothetical protein RCG19_21010 [Neobacillus sp. OS1-2]|uniref:hypothetical protein n=1 Tax=Neobacillus sp. OS1-2 TaxID=3070680 RepID=UPI0027DFAB05|nr:hypothetical protein [Neobacillus sp. OS1-2]WML39624.1 hypothetical protein RCG19_21010 [Neobacillus sp. OS1-2]
MNFKKLLFLTSIIFALIITIFIQLNNKSDNTNISLIEAYELGLTIAQKRDSTADLIFMNSVDDGKNSGFDGKRGSWNLMFALPEKEKRLLVVIESGKIKTTRTLDEITKEEVIKRNEISINSNKAVMNASKNYGLKPGYIKNFFNGYHFKLEKEDNKVFFAVVGVNKENNLTDIYFNARNGEFFGGSTRQRR